MKVLANIDNCIASGVCVLECPQVFGQNELGQVVVLDEKPAADLHELVRKAVSACPTSVLEIIYEQA